MEENVNTYLKQGANSNDELGNKLWYNLDINFFLRTARKSQ